MKRTGRITVLHKKLQDAQGRYAREAVKIAVATMGPDWHRHEERRLAVWTLLSGVELAVSLEIAMHFGREGRKAKAKR